MRTRGKWLKPHVSSFFNAFLRSRHKIVAFAEQPLLTYHQGRDVRLGRSLSSVPGLRLTASPVLAL
jgi:hypothetical protein